MEDNIKKIVLAIKKMEIILKEALADFPTRDLENLLNANRMFFLKKEHLEDVAKLKTKLYEMADSIRKKYENLIKQPEKVFSEIFNEINLLFPEIFPNDYEEFRFKKLMEKAFSENKTNYFDYFNDYEKLHNKKFNKY